MAVVVTGKYLGKKRVELTHEPSGSTLLTDAPKDNQGEGIYFSPTDLVGTSLISCMMTTMSIYAERENLDLTGMHARVEKHMKSDPRRIGELTVSYHLPKSLSPEDRKKLERIAFTCPVHRSIHPDVSIPVEFNYDV